MRLEERSVFTVGNICDENASGGQFKQCQTLIFKIGSGSTHQSDRRFSNVSRGRQCAFTSLSTLLRANSCRVSQWTADTVDEILMEGDAMYVPIQKHCR